MGLRLQFVVPEIEDINSCPELTPKDKCFIGSAPAPNRPGMKSLVVLTDDYDIELYMRMKYTGCETYITEY